MIYEINLPWDEKISIEVLKNAEKSKLGKYILNQFQLLNIKSKNLDPNFRVKGFKTLFQYSIIPVFHSVFCLLLLPTLDTLVHFRPFLIISMNLSKR